MNIATKNYFRLRKILKKCNVSVLITFSEILKNKGLTYPIIMRFEIENAPVSTPLTPNHIIHVSLWSDPDSAIPLLLFSHRGAFQIDRSSEAQAKMFIKYTKSIISALVRDGGGPPSSSKKLL